MNVEFVKELGRIVHERDLEGWKQVKKDLSETINMSSGLTARQVEENKWVFGSNILPETKDKSFLEFVWEASQDKILLLLAASAVVSLIVHWRGGGWIEGVAILTAVVIVILVNSINDYEKNRLFRALNKKSREGLKIRVIRDGNCDLIPVHDLTIFDLIQLEPGIILPADAILFHEIHEIVVDESAATGESRTLTKSFENDPFFLSGTRITDGSGVAIVVAIGEASFHGKILMSMRGEGERTPLQIQLDMLADSIAKYGLMIAVFLFVALIAKAIYQSRLSWLLEEIPEYLIEAITVIVVAVPEGLPMAVTLALAFATSRMLKDNNLVRVLSSCETMGRVTSICSDKTGTLTENRMTVVRHSLPQDSSEEFNKIVIEGLAVNSTAFEVLAEESDSMKFVGSATEAALLIFLKDHFKASYVEERKRVGDLNKMIPFSSSRKLMISVTESGTVHLKGAAQIVLAKCKHILRPDGTIDTLSEADERDIKRLFAEMSTGTLRNIGQAFSQLDADESIEDVDLINNHEFTWIGVYGIEDPLRVGVEEAVRTCQRAGIFVRMITGDCRETAESIARRCGILMTGGLVLEGPDFRNMSDDQLIAQIPHLQVLARSSPMDKERLVRLLKNSIGEIIAVTGDGSNDGPALKAAHVGFSMGITGTQLAQEASSIILLDDNFASIVKAVSWGRCIGRSVKKFIQFQLTVNIAAVLTAVITSLTSKKSVLSAVQMLWVNLIMDSLGALALATDFPTPKLLERPPDQPDAPLITPAMAWQIGSQATLQLLLCLGLFYTMKGEMANTFVFNMFVFLQLFNELNCRSFDESIQTYFEEVFDVKNWMFWLIWVMTIGGQFCIVQFGGRVFGTVPLSAVLWGISVGLGTLSIPVAILVKLIRTKIISNSSTEFRSSLDQLHPSREQLAWRSAIKNIQVRRRFYTAIRRRLDSEGGDGEALLLNKESEDSNNNGAGPSDL